MSKNLMKNKKEEQAIVQNLQPFRNIDGFEINWSNKRTPHKQRVTVK